jgi:hypothetical protein
MSKIGKPYERPLLPELAEEILNIPFDDPNLGLPPAVTIGEHVRRATAAVEAANKMLATSTSAQIIAKSLMRDLKKRGSPSLYVTPDGTVMLRIAYDGTEEPEADKEVPVVRPTAGTDLPKLDKLRGMAAELGLDISNMGRKRRAIYKLIQDKRAELDAGVDEVQVTKAPKPSKTRKRRKGPDNGTDEPPPAPTPKVSAPLSSPDMTIDDLLSPAE